MGSLTETITPTTVGLPAELRLQLSTPVMQRVKTQKKRAKLAQYCRNYRVELIGHMT